MLCTYRKQLLAGQMAGEVGDGTLPMRQKVISAIGSYGSNLFFNGRPISAIRKIFLSLFKIGLLPNFCCNDQSSNIFRLLVHIPSRTPTIASLKFSWYPNPIFLGCILNIIIISVKCKQFKMGTKVNYWHRKLKLH